MRHGFSSILLFIVLPATGQLSAQVSSGIGAVAGGVTGAQAQPQPQGPVQLVLEYKTVQTLADGTHLTNTRREYFYRDSQGRTRTENEPLSGMPGVPRMRNVSVRDQQAGVFYNWTVGQPNAPREYSKTLVNRIPEASMLRMLQAPPPPAPPPPPTPTPTPTLVRIVPPPSGSTPPSQPTVATPPQPADSATRPQVKREDLGVQDVQGFACVATRTTTTYPEGFFGNDRPITQVNERCTSREFGRVLQSHVTDPRTGEQTTTLISISRAEPDASLFQPPADYTERKQNQH